VKTHEKPWEQSFGLRVFIKICEAAEVLGQNNVEDMEESAIKNQLEVGDGG